MRFLSLSAAALTARAAGLALAFAAGCAAPGQLESPEQLRAWARSQEELGVRTFEELWVIERSPEAGGAVSAGFRVRDPSTGEVVNLPASKTELKAEVVGRLATVGVRQRFENPFSTPVDGEYFFPLPRNAAVTEFVVTIGTRNIRAIVREREEARRIYAAARAQGLLASLLREESPGRFTHRFTGLAPRTPIEVRLEYLQGIGCEGGWCELALPLARRAETDHVSLDVTVDACAVVEEVACEPRAALERPDPERISLRLGELEPGPGSELRLRYKVKEGQAALLGSDDADGGTFCLLLYPPAASDLSGGSGGSGDLEIDWGDLEARDVYADSREAPGEARVLLGRYRGGAGRIRLRWPGEEFVAVELRPKSFPARSLARTWARCRIGDLSRQAAAASDPKVASRCADAMLEVALAHGLCSFLTAFVMVDARS